MSRSVSKINWRRVLSFVLIIALVMAAVGLIVHVVNDDREEISSLTAFSRGSLDSTGKYVDVKTSIYTEEAFGCRGLRVEPSFEFIGTYDVYYYDYDGKFIEAKRGLQGVYDEDYPLAKLARIVINPELDSGDDKIPWYSVTTLAKKFEITVDKDQTWIYDTANLYDDAKALYDYNFYMGADGSDVANTTGDVYLPLVEFEGCKVSEEIPLVEGCGKYDIYYRFTELTDMYTFNVVATSEGKILKSVIKHSLSAEIGEWIMVTIEVPNDETADHLRVRMANCAECYIFGYN